MNREQYYKALLNYGIQSTIGVWRLQTFGPEKDLQRMLDRMDQEYQELLEVITDRPQYASLRGADFMFQQKHTPDMQLWRSKIINEMADVLVTMYAVAHLLQEDLNEAVIKKQQVNCVEREWRALGDGTGQHIKEKHDTDPSGNTTQ